MIPFPGFGEGEDGASGVLAGRVRGLPAGKRGALLLAGMVARQTVCLRQAADGERGRIVQFNRFLGNPKVTVERIIDHWGELTGPAAAANSLPPPASRRSFIARVSR